MKSSIMIFCRVLYIGGNYGEYGDDERAVIPSSFAWWKIIQNPSGQDRSAGKSDEWCVDELAAGVGYMIFAGCI